MMMTYPRIHLVLDNCIAIKRWIKPSEWFQIAQDLGFRYIQASTDNEIDPLFSSAGYMDDWFEEVKKLQKKTGIRVINFYTGYQTYRTVGLAHYDIRNRTKISNDWIKNLIKRIADLQAKGVGFCFFAIPHNTLQNPDQYREIMDLVCEQMADIADFAFQNGGVQISNEQMYAPHQPPFTIKGTREFLQSIYVIKKRPNYVTIDVGHMVGQGRFVMPSKEKLEEAVSQNNPIWLGSDEAHQKFDEAVARKDGKRRSQLVDEILADIYEHDYLFSNSEDTDPYKWLESLACYSPIIHMQQTNGISSSHAAFTPETNKDGIIKGNQLLRAIKKSYDMNEEVPMQGLVEDIYLSFEIFASNVESKREIITKLQKTIDYWREFVPEDGIVLNELV
ncbi:MAG: TIM barrel protein [Eubacteriales bacterium]